MTYFNLNRRFVERESYDQYELIAAQMRGKLVGWDKVLENRCSVIVAAANFGKTTELRQQAALLRAKGETALFIVLRQLADRGTLERTLEGDDRGAYRTWKAAPAGRITVFVDSLDEAAAGKKENIAHLVRDVAEELNWPNEHVRWVISTRPAVLTSGVFEKLSTLLSRPAPEAIGGAGGTGGLGRTGATSVAVDGEEPLRLRLFSMAPLDDAQAAVYLNEKHPVLNAEKLLKIASERGLSGFVRSPGGLAILACIDMVANPPTSLTDVFDRVVNAIGSLHGADHRLVDAGNPATKLLTDAAQRLAAASSVCQLVNIEIPEATLEVPEKALSARHIASSLLPEAGLKQLLNSQLFIDAGFHQVKIYPDELVPFLAAKRFAGLVESQPQAERLLENFTWSAPSGEQGVQRNFLPMMGWLATLNPHCREVILQKDPQALAFFGDLRNPDVPLAAAQQALTESIKRLVEQGDHIGRGRFELTSENFWQAGSERLAPTVLSLYDQYKDNNWARYILINIATACKLASMRDTILARHGRNFAQVLSDSSDVGYFLAMGRPADLAELASAAMASTTVGEGVVSLLLRELNWQYFSPRDVAVLVHNQFLSGPRGFLLSYSLENACKRAVATNGQLYQLARGLIVRMVRWEKTHSGNRERKQYVDLIATVLEALVVRTNSAESTKVARLYLLLRRVTNRRFPQSSSVTELWFAVSANSSVRVALLRSTVQRKLDDNALQQAVFGNLCPCTYKPEDFTEVNDTQLTRVYSQREAYPDITTAQSPRLDPTKPKSEKPTISAEVMQQLRDRLSALADGVDTQALEWIAAWLLQITRSSRYGEVDFEAFEQAAGEEIAAATRQGLSRLWRNKAPMFEEDKPNSTFHISAAGLQGLNLEFGTGDVLPTLTDAEVCRALRYALIEINGHPKWFWALVETHPAVAVPELISIASEATYGLASRKHAEELLKSIPDAPAIVQEALAGIAWSHLVDFSPPQDYDVNSLLKASLSVPGKVPQKSFECMALQKMKAAYSSPLAEPITEPPRAQREHALIWATQWLIQSPLPWRDAVSEWIHSDVSTVKIFILDFAAALGRDREGIAAQIATKSDHGILALESHFPMGEVGSRPEERREEAGRRHFISPGRPASCRIVPRFNHRGYCSGDVSSSLRCFGPNPEGPTCRRQHGRLHQKDAVRTS